jgi:hypothetical protein
MQASQWSSACVFAVCIVVSAGGCDRLGVEGKKGDRSLGSADGGAAAVSDGSPSATAASAASSLEAGAAAGTGRCMRHTCDLAHEVCCEDVHSEQHECIARAHLSDKVHCGKGPDWLLAMDCAQYTGCGPTKVCCKQPVTGYPGFTQDVCEDTCNGTEACVENGDCKGSHACKSDPSERSGGACVLPPKVKEPFVAPPCPAGYMKAQAGYCGLICRDSRECRSGNQCMNEPDHPGTTAFCHKAE